jgi:glycosyltransferase involved in cell wall biosynthesis
MDNISEHIPLVSIIMPVFNGEKYLRQAIDSILTQTFQDFEFIIINDGSIDKTGEILQEFGTRAAVHNRGKNGLVKSLNFGIELARGKYIARMDADDIAFPRRLEKQVDFLDKHDDIGLLGSSAILIDQNGYKLRPIGASCSDIEIRWNILLNSPILHSSAMFRREFFSHNLLRYEETYKAAEDYDLWRKFLYLSKASNLPEPLIYYRVHQSNVTNQNRQIQIQNHIKISAEIISIEFSELKIKKEDLIQLIRLFFLRDGLSVKDLRKQAESVLIYLTLWDAFERKYSNHPCLSCVRHSVSIKSIRMALFPLFQPHCWEALRRISRVEKYWFWNLLHEIPKFLQQR